MPRFLLVLRDGEWNPETMSPEEIQAVLSRYRTWVDRVKGDGQKLRDDVPRLGFKAEIANRNVFTLAQETLRLAARGLQRRKRLDRNGRDETRYLRPLEESIARGITPAEELLEKYHGEWGGSVEPIFSEYAY